MRRSHSRSVLASRLVAWGVAVVTLASLAVPAAAVTDVEIQQAIQQGVQSLYAAQNAQGHWDTAQHIEKFPCGETALVVYALLSAGEQWQNNPKLKRAMEYLKGTETYATYAVGLRAHVWGKLPDTFLDHMKIDGAKLVNGQGPAGRFTYQLSTPRDGDHSNTQYGILGAWEAAKRDVTIQPAFWTKAENNFINLQNGDGGWGYNTGRESTLTMSSAGLTVLFITQDYLHTDDFKRCGVARNHPLQKRINMGLDWVAQNFKASPGGYGSVGIERVGLASGYKYFGDTDWFQTIASRIVGRVGQGGHVNTAFYLVFLSRGRVPVFANKLAIKDFDWNNRPRDLANLTQWFANDVENAMNWQVVTIDRKPEDWLDAPLLYVASHKPLELTEEQELKIKRYLDLGGMLVSTADDASKAFSDSMTKMMAKLYPQYEMKPVEQDDPIYNVHFKLKQSQIPVQTLNNGVRHLVLHVPRDLSWAFHKQSRRSDPLRQFMANAYHYATEKGKTRAKLDRHFETASRGASRTVQVGRAKYDGNWNPEPLAWEVLSNFTTNASGVGMQPTEVDLSTIHESGLPLVHVCGTGPVTFTGEQLSAIKSYVEGGGVLFFEAAGGHEAFVQSVEKALVAAKIAGPARRLPPTHPVITGTGIGGQDARRVSYRKYYKLRFGVSHEPGLQTMMVQGKPRIILSAEDMSVGVLSQPVWGVFGYDSESAKKLMGNIALWAAGQQGG